MSKYLAILELVRLLKPYAVDLAALVKQILDVVKQWRGEEDQAKVGAASPDEVQATLTALKAEGLSEEQARDLLAA